MGSSRWLEESARSSGSSLDEVTSHDTLYFCLCLPWNTAFYFWHTLRGFYHIFKIKDWKQKIKLIKNITNSYTELFSYILQVLPSSFRSPLHRVTAANYPPSPQELALSPEHTIGTRNTLGIGGKLQRIEGDFVFILRKSWVYNPKITPKIASLYFENCEFILRKSQVFTRKSQVNTRKS